MKLTRLLVLILLCFKPLLSSGQHPYFSHFKTRDGLPDNNVYDVFQDAKGYIWFAGGHGLVRYDGYTYKVYPAADQSGMSGSGIQADSLGRIWYCTFDGYLYYTENDSLKSFDALKKPIHFDYRILGDKLFVNDYQLLQVWSIRHRKMIKQFASAATIREKTASGVLGFDENKGIVAFDASGDMRLMVGLQGLSLKDVTYFCAYRGENIWSIGKQDIGDGNPLCCYGGGQIIRKTPTGINNIQHLNLIGDTLYISTTNGLYLYHANGDYLGQHLFPSHSVSKVLRDLQGRFWIGTTNEGYFLLPKLNTFFIPTPFKADRLTSAGGKLIVSSKNEAIWQWDEKNHSFGQLFQSPDQHQVQTFFEDSLTNSLYWVGSSMYALKNNQVTKTASLVGNYKEIVRLDSTNWAIATSSCLIIKNVTGEPQVSSAWDMNKQNPDKFKRLGWEGYQLLYNHRCKGLSYMSRTQKLYVATNKGFFCISPSSVIEIRKDGMPFLAARMTRVGEIIWATDARGVLWFLDAKEIWQKYDKLTEAVQWLKAFTNDLYVFAGKKLIRIEQGNPRNIPKELAIPIPTDELNDLFVEDGFLWATADAGVLKMKLPDSGTQAYIPPFYLEQLVVNGRKIPFKGQSLEFGHKQNNLEIMFSYLSLGQPNTPPLYYQLNEGAWQTLDPQNTLRFADLRPNSYELRFKAGETVYAEKLNFVIRPHFMQTWWFLTLLLLGLAWVVLFVIGWRRRLWEKQNMLLMEKIRLEKDLRNSMLSSIKSQMNPHFIFNALNTIQSFIFSDDKRAASAYLAKFAKLTRKILEMSEQENILFAEELAALKLYLELEQLRFEDNMHYSIDISPGINPESIQIPAMIIQPYVENAIKHGLMHKKGDKKLEIRCQLAQKDLLVEIEDNGVGREKSAQINLQKRVKHHSFATTANRKRIELLNLGNQHIHLQIVDKFDQNQKPAGTLVKIRIPIVFS